MKRLSVIVPVFRVEKYIEACLLSVLESDLPASDWELIVVDDESPDRSMEKVLALEQRFPEHIFRIHRQKNTGISGARNAGLRLATGTYIWFIDSDDYIRDGVSIRGLLEKAETGKLDILEFGIEKRLDSGKPLGGFRASTAGAVFTGVEYYRRCRYVNSVFNKLYRREFLASHGIGFVEKIYVEDFEFNTHAFLHARRVEAIDDVVYIYRQSANSITRSGDKSRKTKMENDHLTVLRATAALLGETRTASENAFLEERMSFLATSLLYLLWRNGSPFREIKRLKTKLQEENLYRMEVPLHQADKDLFRNVIHKNLNVLSVVPSFLRRRL